MPHRLLELATGRVPRWLVGFAERHGEPVAHLTGDALTLTAPDQACARLEVPFGPAPVADLDGLLARCDLARDALLVLVRRGGYGVGLVRDGTLLAHKVGTKYVQGRTAAGGWSQQRFARRRASQTAGLVVAASEALQVLAAQPQAKAARCLVIGGDRLLVGEVLAGLPRQLGWVEALPRSPLLDIADPRLAVVKATAERARTIRIHLDEPDAARAGHPKG